MGVVVDVETLFISMHISDETLLAEAAAAAAMLSVDSQIILNLVTRGWSVAMVRMSLSKSGSLGGLSLSSASSYSLFT